jgi:hypothetical protein
MQRRDDCELELSVILKSKKSLHIVIYAGNIHQDRKIWYLLAYYAFDKQK